MTWLPLVTRIRNIAEHALIAQNEPDPLRQARTTHANLLERAVVAPYFVNYHCEHHLFTSVPCWNLAAAHRALRQQGTTARMTTQPGYAGQSRASTSSKPFARASASKAAKVMVFVSFMVFRSFMVKLCG